jgi:ribonucleoside-diphosphate reductase alpha chain
MEPTAQDHRTGGSLVERYFTRADKPWDHGVNWTRRIARAGDFEMADVEAPDFWSDNAVGVTAKLYFATVDGVRETSVKQMIERVARKITAEGERHGYFDIGAKTDDGVQFSGGSDIFYDELCFLLVHQMAAFNTPVWLNVGVPGRRQVCSACFLLGIDDTMLGDHSIMDWIQTEAAIFKGGAGSGINLSKLRASVEKLSTGGTASGPTSYMRSSDANAGTLKSGGAHRRAAKMVILDADHPDIRDFVDLKRREDRRMRILLEAGEEIDPFTASGEKTIAEVTSGQNSNNSVAASDEFMRRATIAEEEIKPFGDDQAWALYARTTDETVEVINARDLLDDIADAAWTCGDPGMVFLDRANEWHTTPSLGPITTCNPCGETWLNDDSSCNLASLNLVKFLGTGGELVVPMFRAAVDVMVLAMDITCSFSELPTPTIERNTRELRQLGLGYANLGGMLMRQALPYDSDTGRDVAASITALMTGRAYRRSAEIAEKMGAYARFEENREAHMAVMEKHLDAVPPQDYADGTPTVWKAAEGEWGAAISLGCQYGYRNSQATVIAPTGTISIMMDCDTSGCEPEFSLVRHKGIAGGGSMTFVNLSATIALDRLGYSTGWANDMVDAGQSINESVNEEHCAIFDCANDISVEGHVKMVSAIQPFLSGAPSKTINLPESATREDVKRAYVLAWRLGCKCISIYRDGSKVTQVLSAKPRVKTDDQGTLEGGGTSMFAAWDEALQKELDASKVLPSTVRAMGGPHPKPDNLDEVELHRIPTMDPGGAPAEPYRRRLPRERASETYKLSVGEHEGYVTAGRYEEGGLGEIFLTGVGKEGTFLQGMMGAWSIAVSIGLQYGVPPEVYAAKFVGMEFEPKGYTADPAIPEVKSFPDYIWRWLARKYLSIDECEALGVMTPEVKQRLARRLDDAEHPVGYPQTRALPTHESTSAKESAKQFLRKQHERPMPMGMSEGLSVQPGGFFSQRLASNGHARERGTKPCTCGGIMHATGTCYTCSSCGQTTGCG